MAAYWDARVAGIRHRCVERQVFSIAGEMDSATCSLLREPVLDDAGSPESFGGEGSEAFARSNWLAGLGHRKFVCLSDANGNHGRLPCGNGRLGASTNHFPSESSARRSNCAVFTELFLGGVRTSEGVDRQAAPAARITQPQSHSRPFPAARAVRPFRVATRRRRRA